MNDFIIRSVAPKRRCLFIGNRNYSADSNGDELRSSLDSGGWLVTDLENGTVRGGEFDIVLIEDPGSYPVDTLRLVHSSGALTIALVGQTGLTAECIPYLDLFFCKSPALTGPLRDLGKPALFVAPGLGSAEKILELVERHWRYRKERERYARVDWSRISYGHTVISRDQVGAEMARSWQSPDIPARQRALVQSELADMYQGRIPEIFQVLAQALRPHVATGTPVLEIGCASGYYYEILEYLLNRRIRYVGVDYSGSLTAMARSFYPRTPFITADGGKLPFRDGAFRIAISSCILLHVPDYRAHIRETVRISGGLVIAHRTPICRRKPTQYHKKFAYGVETVELVFNEEELLEAFRQEGMEKIEMMEFSSDPAEDTYHATYVFEKVASPEAPAETTEDLLSQGEKHFNAGAKETARELFRRVTAREPQNPRLLNDLGVLACEDGDLVEAERLFEAARSADPDNPKYMKNLAELLIALERPGQALSLLAGCLDKFPGDEDIRRLLQSAGPAGIAEPEPPRRAEAATSGRKGPISVSVLWQNRDDMEAAPGGDTTVVREITRNLSEMGVPNSISLVERPSLAGIDVVQLNNISRTRDTLAQLANARAIGKPTVLIPLYEDMDRYLVPAMKTDLLFRYLAMKKTTIPLEQIGKVRDSFQLDEHPLDNKFARMFGIGDASRQGEILAGVDYILTSGAAESESIRLKFKPAAPMGEMSYGFNDAFRVADPAPFTRKHGLKDFVLCVGRLEPRKNQWQLIEVFRSLPHLQLVLVGVFSDPSMEPLIKGNAPPNVRFFDRLPFEELVSAYAAARVHVLPSWYELPGLVSLEAAAAGSRVVASDWGTARDYLGDRVEYCTPDNPMSIRSAVLKAYDSPKDPGLRDYVIETFSWKRAAARCLEVYEEVLSRRNQRANEP